MSSSPKEEGDAESGDSRRGKQSSRKRSADEVDSADDEMDDEIPESLMHETPGEARDLEAAIAKLPARARQVFVLMDIEGYSHEETATMLGIAEGTSKAQLFRARELLRGSLA